MLRYHRNVEQTREREIAVSPSELTEEGTKHDPECDSQSGLSGSDYRGVSLHRRKYFISSNTITVIGQLYMLSAGTGRRRLVFFLPKWKRRRSR